MHKVNYLISLTMMAALALSGCGTEQKKKESNRSTTTNTTEQDPNKGRLGLRMPKKDKRPYAKLEITLQRQSECYGYADGGEPEPTPMPEPVPAIEDIAKTKEVSAEANLRTEVDHGDQPIDNMPVCDGDYSVSSYTETFDFKEDAEVSIPNIEPGNYSITVRLLGKGGEAIEEGYGWAYVSPGIVTQAVVELYPTKGNGQLDILIVRGGDRVDYNDHDFQCAPSAYVDQDGKVQYGDCYHGAGPSVEDKPETGVAK